MQPLRRICKSETPESNAVGKKQRAGRMVRKKDERNDMSLLGYFELPAKLGFLLLRR